MTENEWSELPEISDIDPDRVHPSRVWSKSNEQITEEDQAVVNDHMNSVPILFVSSIATFAGTHRTPETDGFKSLFVTLQGPTKMPPGMAEAMDVPEDIKANGFPGETTIALNLDGAHALWKTLGEMLNTFFQVKEEA